MAFAAQLGALAEELIEAICPDIYKSERGRLGSIREQCIKTLRHHNFARTNQFLVQDHLEGLQEKFIVHGRDGLAAALESRLDNLGPLSTKWTPDILHLLLELSDRPLQQSHLADLDLLQGQDLGAGPRLKWEDIAEDDGWTRDRALWKNVDFGPGSSEDELYEEQSVTDGSSESEDISISDPATQLRQILQDIHPIGPRPVNLDDVSESQSWRLEASQPDESAHSRKTIITEAQVVRETLFMLQGHRTSLFDQKCNPVLAYQLSEVSWETYRALITAVAEIGRPLQPLRAFVGSQQDLPLLQTFQDRTRDALRAFNMEIAAMQARYADPRLDVVVSIMAVMEEAQGHLASLRSLGAIVQRLREERYPHAFRYLELLFEATCASQFQGDLMAYQTLGSTFLKCFQVYLRPIRTWMEEGELLPGDKIFFISESKVKLPLNQIWQNQFKLRQTLDGRLHAPRFLQFAVARIYTTGKSVVVLKHLGMYDRTASHQQSRQPPSLDFGDVCPPGSELAPFSELFANAFDAWIRSKHHATSSVLQKALFESCGLWSTLSALQRLYLITDGAASDSFTSAVFAKMETMQPGWDDRFTLTELVQEAFSGLLDVHRVSASLDEEESSTRSDADSRRVSIRETLPRLKLRYRMVWPVQLVLRGEYIEKYQFIYTILLQVRRSVYALNMHRLLLGEKADAGMVRAESSTYYRLRTSLLWFCNTFMTYLTTLVFTPNIAALKEALSSAEDVDGMIHRHATFIAAMIEESCLGPRLDPIRECMLDVLDLAVELEYSRNLAATREANQSKAIMRLSAITPSHRALMLSPAESRKSQLRGLYLSPKEKEEDHEGAEGLDDEDQHGSSSKTGAPVGLGSSARRVQSTAVQTHETYPQTLRRISADFERHLKFIAGGLRGVARASSDTAAGKWDILAEMLEAGILAM